MNITAKDKPGANLADQITNYLANGGLFNPESMEHTRVRNLLIDCRDYLIRFADAPEPKPPETVQVYYTAYGIPTSTFSRSDQRTDLAGQTFIYELRRK